MPAIGSVISRKITNPITRDASGSGGGSPFGPNLVVGGGTFDSDTGWTLTSDATITGGQLLMTYDGSGTMSATCTATGTITAGTYRCSLEVINQGDAGVDPVIFVGGASGALGMAGTGVFTVDIVTAAASQLLVIRGGSLGAGIMGLVADNFSVRRIL